MSKKINVKDITSDINIDELSVYVLAIIEGESIKYYTGDKYNSYKWNLDIKRAKIHTRLGLARSRQTKESTPNDLKLHPIPTIIELGIGKVLILEDEVSRILKNQKSKIKRNISDLEHRLKMYRSQYGSKPADYQLKRISDTEKEINEKLKLL